MNQTRLNIFQRLARRWESVHPYNAAQVMRIDGTVDGAAADDAWAQSLRAHGIGHVEFLQGATCRHHALNGQMSRYPCRRLATDTSLASHLTDELNRPFDDPHEPPFRPFIIQRESDFYFGVVYQHWIADSVSIRSLMNDWFARLYDPGAPRRRLKIDGQSYWRLFGARGNWRLDETVLANFRSHMRHRRVAKVQCAGARDYPVRVTLHAAPDGLIERLVSAARELGVKVHDILLAAMAEACRRYLPMQFRRNRPDLSVGSIIDLRRHAAGDLTDAFGLFLGFTNVVCRPSHLQNWDRLLRTVAAQNRHHKQNGLAQVSMMWMTFGIVANQWVPDRKLYAFYRKELPMAGGLSNVNLNSSWAAQYHPHPLKDYIRISPTGPMVPVVFSTTTLGSGLSLALTSRQSLLDPRRAEQMAQCFMRRLQTTAASTVCQNLNGD